MLRFTFPATTALFVYIASAQPAPERVIAFGTAIDPAAQVEASRELAKAQAKPDNPQWRAKGDQHRTYRFPATNADMPYRIAVPSAWDGKSSLPLVLMLHGAGSNENMYV